MRKIKINLEKLEKLHLANHVKDLALPLKYEYLKLVPSL
jgi:hypothetical protein